MSMPESDAVLVWFRRDLRLEDNATLAAAAAEGRTVFGCFIFDPALLEPLPRDDRRVSFIRDALAELNARWAALVTGGRRQSGIRLIFLQGDPRRLVPLLANRLGVSTVFAGRDVEPSAKARDAAVASALKADGRRLALVKDQVVFTSNEVLTGDGRPFSVFTPYRNAWRKRLRDDDLAPASLPPDGIRLGVPPAIDGELPRSADDGPELSAIGFERQADDVSLVRPGASGGEHALRAFLPRLGDYRQQRDFPALNGTSRLSVHLRFGTLSIRALARLAWQEELASGSDGARCWLDELIWREFYQAVLDCCPWVVDGCWRREYDAIRWDEAPALFDAWCKGQTGYPLVDAAMRELVSTGFMHNRARMVVASFLTKDFGIDWRLGERFFARHLLDYDLAANNGGWQWAASTGCDAQPYFRIFNPVTQSEKFDPTGEYIRRWVPELAAVPLRALHAPWVPPSTRGSVKGFTPVTGYPAPIVDHAEARERTLARYGAARDQR